MSDKSNIGAWAPAQNRVAFRHWVLQIKTFYPNYGVSTRKKGVFALVADANYVVNGQHTRAPCTIVKGGFRGGAEGAAAPYFSNIFKAVL